MAHAKKLENDQAAAKARKAAKAATKTILPAHGTRAPGSACEALNVIVNGEEAWVQIAGSRWSIVAIRHYLGKDVCWPLAITKQAQTDTCCLSPHLPGHRVGDDHLHQITDAQRSHILANFSIFGMHQGNHFRRPYEGKGKGKGKGARPGKGGGAPLAIKHAPAPPIAPPSVNSPYQTDQEWMDQGNGQPC